MDDCGMDGAENLALNYPFCCKRHLKESREHAAKEHKKMTKELLQ